MDSQKAPWASLQIWIFALIGIIPQLQELFTTLELSPNTERIAITLLSVAGIIARTVSSGNKIALPIRRSE